MTKPVILIVEDDPLISIFIKEVLEGEGYEVAPVARDYGSAIQLISAIQPALLILDVNLEGEKSGIDVAKTVRQTKPEIPFIYLTAYYDPETRTSAFATQPAAYLTKPFKESDLILAAALALSQDHPVDAGTDLNHASEGFLLSDHLFIKDRRNYRKFRISDICWIKGDGSYCEIHTYQGKTVIRNVLKKFDPLLDRDGFLKVHRSYVVNIANITEIGPKGLKFGEDVVPVKKEVRDLIVERVRKIE
ncbi:MAG: response regulator transcription factor [Bacteroidota bacterium]